jgi:signal peptidase II
MAGDSSDVPLAEPGGDLMGGGPDLVAVASVPAAEPPRPGIRWWLVVAIIAADALTKMLVRGSVALFDSRPLIPGLVDLAHVRNEGLAFGLLNGTNLPYKWVLTTALALAALLGITLYARHIDPRERIARVGLSMILGGALGNLLDRLFTGYVLDFVDVYVRGWHFWAFNVADAAISIGAVLVFVDLLLVRPHASHSV